MDAPVPGAHDVLGHVLEGGNARLALVAWDCGCTTYAPLDLLHTRRAPKPAHDPAERRTEPSFDSDSPAPHRAASTPSAPNGVQARIDDRSTEGPTPPGAEHAALQGQHAGERDGRGRSGGVAPPRSEGAPTPETGSIPAGSTSTVPPAKASPLPSPGAASAAHRAPPRRTRGGHGANATSGPYWTRERIIAALQRHAVDGVAPRIDEWRKSGGDDHPSTAQVYKVFPLGWQDACNAAGLRSRAEVDRAARAATRPTREQAIEQLQAWARQHGRTPGVADWHSTEGGKHMSASTVQAIFADDPGEGAGWTKAIAAAGLEQRPRGRAAWRKAHPDHGRHKTPSRTVQRAARLENLIRDVLRVAASPRSPTSNAAYAIELLRDGLDEAAAP